MRRTVWMVAVGCVVLLGACGHGKSATDGSASGGCTVSDGVSVDESAMTASILGCMFHGVQSLPEGYDDCKDGSHLWAMGDSDGPDGGWVVFRGGGSATWHDGPWHDALVACHGQ